MDERGEGTNIEAVESPPAKEVPVQRITRKTTAKESAAKKSTAKKTTAKKTTAKKAAAKKTTAKTSAKKSTARKSTAKKTTAKTAPAKTSSAKDSTARGTGVPPENLQLYRRLLAAVPGAKEKSNFGSSFTSVRGNMYSIVSKHGVVGLRLPAEERMAFLKRHRTTLFRGDPSWPPAKEYVVVPDRLLRNTKVLAPYLELSYRYALSLKPKGK